MKKHYCRIGSHGFAACDSGLRPPHHDRTTKNKRCTRKSIIAKMDHGGVCQACIRIAVAERLCLGSPSSVFGKIQGKSIDYTVIDEMPNCCCIPLPIMHKDFSFSSEQLAKHDPMDIGFF